jgi:mono/diheme cytochrome c family protein
MNWHRIVLLGCAAIAAYVLSTPVMATDTVNNQGGGTSSSLSVALGKQDFETYCASCHGESGLGDGPVAEFIAIEAADLTKLARKNGGEFPTERVQEIIDGRTEVKVHGPRDMPVWGDWFDDEANQPGLRAEERELVVRERIAALAGYLQTLQEK